MAGTEEAFSLFVRIRALDEFTPVFKRMASLSQQYAAATDKVQKSLIQSKAMMAVGAGMTGVGIAMAYGLGKAVESASNLQIAIQNVAQATHATKSQIRALTNESMTLGIQTSLSSVQTAGILAAMSQAGLPSNLLYNRTLAGQYVNFADVLYNRTGADTANTAAEAVSMSHLFQLYNNPKQLSSFLDNLNAVLAHSHTTLDSFSNQFKYFGATAKNLGMSANEALMMQALATRMGVGGSSRSGGSSINDFLLRAVTPASKKAMAAMLSSGLWSGTHSAFVDSNGNFVGLPAAIQVMQQFRQRYHGNAANMSAVLKTIFGVQGKLIAPCECKFAA